MSKPFKKLRSKSENDIQWKAYNFALGAEDGSSEINVSKNSYSSSLLEMLPSHSTSAPESEFISQEKITVKRLNEVYNDVDTDERCCYLKVDTQGYEQQVLLGGNVVIENFKLIQLEMSIVPMYSGEATFREMLDFMEDLGFGLVSLEPGFSDKRSGQLLQVDGVFANKDLLNDKSLIG
jgi:FkbM family methyltransferase